MSFCRLSVSVAMPDDDGDRGTARVSKPRGELSGAWATAGPAAVVHPAGCRPCTPITAAVRALGAPAAALAVRLWSYAVAARQRAVGGRSDPPAARPLRAGAIGG